MIYFDNAATTFPKPTNVLRDVRKCLKKYCANPGRSAHALAIQSAEAVYSVRERLADFLSFDYPERIVFTSNATHALNLAILTSIREKCHVICSDAEHNSVLRPIYYLQSRLGVEISFFRSGENLEERIPPLIRSDTKAIVCTLCSNVSGIENSLSTLAKIKEAYNLMLIVDASQIVGHKPISLKDVPCDILCAPGHKSLFGMQGVGFAVFCDGKIKEEFMLGGTGSDSKNRSMPNFLPERYEAGTVPVPSIVSVGSGIDFINSVGIDEVSRKIDILTQKAKEILDDAGGVRYVGDNGIVSFFCDGIPSSAIASVLNGYGICVRNGFHCAPTVHKTLGSEEYGTVRISFSYLNKINQLDVLYRALKQIKSFW